MPPPTSPVGPILQLAAMQIEVALQAAESQVTTLSDSIAAIAAIAAALPASLGESAAALKLRTRDAIMAMQYHDQMMQRLAHVRDALTDVQRAMAEPVGAGEWWQLLNKVRNRFSMEDERQLFDSMVAWPAERAAQPEGPVADSMRGCVELF